MNKYVSALLAGALSLGLAGTVDAQRSISGRVINALTQQPLPGALVSVVGTTAITGTRDDGTFTITAPEGPVTLLVRLIGYQRRRMLVPADQSTVDIALETDVFNLDAVVVTPLCLWVLARC